MSSPFAVSAWALVVLYGDGGSRYDAESPYGIYSTKEHAETALKKLLLQRMLRDYSLEELAVFCDDAIVKKSEGEWRLTPDADIFEMYKQSGQEFYDQNSAPIKWTYDLTEFQVDATQDPEYEDEEEKNVSFLLDPENRKRKSDSEEKSSAKKAKPACASE